MLKKALIDCANNTKCCSVDGGRGLDLPSFFVHIPDTLVIGLF